jgi:hypothetical protein
LLATLSLGVRELHLLTRSASERRDGGA